MDRHTLAISHETLIKGHFHYNLIYFVRTVLHLRQISNMETEVNSRKSNGITQSSSSTSVVCLPQRTIEY